MRVVLSVCTGPSAGKKLVVQPDDVVTVGRGGRADLTIPDDSLLSSRHFQLVCVATGCTIEDLLSSNGTILNGNRIRRSVLGDGDRIVAGQGLFEVTIEESGSTPAAERLAAVLQRQGPLFAILDAARDRAILRLLEDDIDGEVQCLYDGNSALDLAEYAPYLVSLPAGSDLLNELLRLGWGASWGTYFTSREPISTLRHHFRQFLIVQKSDGKEAYFRFYDPRVLRIHLEGLIESRLSNFFGPVESYLMESDRQEYLLRFTQSGQRCLRESLPVRRM